MSSYHISPITVDGYLVNNDVQKLSSWSDYFRSISSSPVANDDTVNIEMIVSERRTDIEFCYNGIVKLLSCLKPEKAAGPDGIPNYVLKT